MKQCWPAPERNRQPILDVLMRVFPRQGTALEIASGSGQHAVFFASAFPGLIWQPSDVDAENLASIRAWVSEAGLPNLRPPLELDVLGADWGVGTLDGIFCANMIHIAPWECCLGLFAGVGRYLNERGAFVLYGPFKLDGQHISESNASFDAGLRARDPRWGVRDIGEVASEAERVGLKLLERVLMPSNNQCLVFRRA